MYVNRHYRRYYLALVRHGRDVLDEAWEQAKGKRRMLGVPTHGLERDIPAIELGLEDYGVLAKEIYNDHELATALCYNNLSMLSSCKLRARQSIETLGEDLRTCFRHSLTIQRIRYLQELNGRNLGFTWHRTEIGLKKVFTRKQYRSFRKDPFNFAPPGGESVADVVARISSIIHDVMNSPRNYVLMTHHDNIPIIEDLLEGREPDESVMRRADSDELGNATAKIWVRESGEWKPYKTISGRQDRDYSKSSDAVKWHTPPEPSGIAYLDQARELRRHRYA